ncbi:hypothetical protein [Aquimarina sp. 2304DJ70-9]|uniref:hypothetical protein n=1 Tax=Aquimarina penaris TaxID=3231044 RepID=UPI0034628625
MKRSQSTFVIFAMLMLAVVLTGFTTKSTSQNATLDGKEVTVDQTSPSFLIGTWIHRDDPENIITFNADKTVVEKTKEKTTNNTWTHNDKKREVCIGSSRCIYYEATESALFLYINKKKSVYYKSREKQ